MEAIICGISAWQYHRVPPLVRDVEIDVARAIAPAPAGLAMPPGIIAGRSDARAVERLVRSRILTDLKGLSLPIHLMVPDSSGMHETRLVHSHRIPKRLPREHLVDLGNGLFVLSPELTVMLQGTGASKVKVAKMMFEACGLFSLLPSNDRIDLVASDLVSQGVLVRESFGADSIFGYSDDAGRPLGFLDWEGNPLGWTPAFDRLGRLTDLWKRPPLTSVEELICLLSELGGLRGLGVARTAVKMVRNGAASPEEARCCMLLCSGARHGGEAFGSPDLNRQIQLSPEAQALSGLGFCVGDLVWKERRRILEVQSKGFHADAQGFEVTTGRRAGLESMGYELLEVTPHQMAHLELLDAMLPSFSSRLGFKLRKRTAAFLARRNALHAELYGSPYDEC